MYQKEIEDKSKKEIIDPFGFDNLMKANEKRNKIGLGSSTMYNTQGRGVIAQ